MNRFCHTCIVGLEMCVKFIIAKHLSRQFGFRGEKNNVKQCSFPHHAHPWCKCKIISILKQLGVNITFYITWYFCSVFVYAVFYIFRIMCTSILKFGKTFFLIASFSKKESLVTASYHALALACLTGKNKPTQMDQGQKFIVQKVALSRKAPF